MSKKDLWVYLRDMHGSTNILNLENQQKMTVYPTQVKDGAPIGMRRFLLEQTGANAWRETGEQADMTEELFDVMVESHVNVNGWNFDWPNFQYESSVTKEEIDQLAAKLKAMMAKHPFETQVWVQPRMLLYYSDGSYKSQKKFLTLAPHPGTSPYSPTGEFKKKYLTDWDNEAYKANKPQPEGIKAQGGGAPLLYRGKAFLVRFTLDDQQPAFEHTRVYVEPNGQFICSDWCQRHDFSSYEQGINLQSGIYDFDSWILNACIPRAMKQGVFKPKSAEIKREQVRDLIKREGRPVKIPTYDEAMAEAAKKVKLEYKVLPEDVLVRLVSESYVKSPHAGITDCIDGLVEQFKAAYANKALDALVGAPILIKTNEFYAGTADITKYEVEKGLYCFTITSGDCGAVVTPGNVCIKTPEGFHNHVNVSQFKLAIPQLETSLAEAIKRRADQLAANAPAIDAGPITATALAEAKKLVYGYDDASLEVERAELMQLNIEKASKMKVEVADTYVVPAVVPQVTTYDSTFGQAEIHSIKANGLVGLVNWLTGPFSKNEARYIRNQPEHLEALPPGASLLDDSKWEPVLEGSPLAEIGVWYFEHFLPTQLKAQHKAEATAVDFEVDGNSFRAYPVIDGATIQKVVGGAVIESVTIRKKSNGHIYRVEEDGNTVLFADGDLTLKGAAAYYLKYLLAGHEKSLKLNSIAKELVTA